MWEKRDHFRPRGGLHSKFTCAPRRLIVLGGGWLVVSNKVQAGNKRRAVKQLRMSVFRATHDTFCGGKKSGPRIWHFRDVKRAIHVNTHLF